MSCPSSVEVEWKGKRFRVSFAKYTDVAHLKRVISRCVGVAPQFLDFGEILDGPMESETVSLLSLKWTPDSVIYLNTNSDYYPGTEAEESGVHVLRPPRENKPLLVLDIDDTIGDCSACIDDVPYLGARPYLKEFLQRCYQLYDLALFSATEYSTIRFKILMFGMKSENFVLIADRKAMFPANVPILDLVQCKPLYNIWDKVEQYSSKNTIMVDDVALNFALNPRNAIHIAPYKHANHSKDIELLKLGAYLEYLCKNVDDFSSVSHCNWRNHLTEEQP